MVSDDIVILLRKYQPYNKLHGQAADEIERLQELADNLYKTLLYYPCQCGFSPCKCGYDDMMDEYKEVRGE